MKSHHDKKPNETRNNVAIFAGVVASIIGAAIAIRREVYADTGSPEQKTSNVNGPDDTQKTNYVPSPPAGGGGPVSGGQQAGTVTRNEVTTFESQPETPYDLSPDVSVAIQQIKDLSNQTGLSNEQLKLVNYKEQTVNVSTPGGTVIHKQYVLPDGRVLNSEQEVLDEFIKSSFTKEVKQELAKGDGKSTIEALFAGSPINATAFITSRPESFPEAKSDTKFLQRAQAVEPSLTVDNPGGSSNARVPNFSRLAAVSTDLTKVDLYGVQNPDFLGEIKSGQGPLTASQRILVDQQRLAIDPRNMTSSDRAEITANQQAATAEKAVINARAESLKAGGYNEPLAKAYLYEHGINVNGQLSAKQFAVLEATIK
jgi:hypothetical protein